MNNDNIEIWRKIIINDEETNYMVSNLGNVYSVKNDMILKPLPTNNGYFRVRIYIKNSSVYKSIHRLVAIAFIDNPEMLPIVNHKDGDKSNNNVNNLEWATYSENTIHAYNKGLNHIKYGDESHLSKYTRKQVIDACELMESGIYTLPEIELLTNIDVAMLYMIRKRASWINVSIFYDVENCKQVKMEYSEDQIERVFQLLEENKISIYDIMDITGVKTSTIYNILIRRNTKCAYLYNIYNIDNFDKNKQLPDIPPEIKEEIINRVNDGDSIKKIVKDVSEHYNFNVDRLRHFANRYNYKYVQRLSKG